MSAFPQAEEWAAEFAESTAVKGGFDLKALLAWAAVGIPLAWGIWITLEKALVLFM